MLYEKDLDFVLQEIMTRWDIPGLAVGIVEGGEIVYAKGFGVQSLETQAPVTLDSIFCIQSVSKCFVATAVMQLVERGILDLDTPIVQYLPYFQISGEGYRQITIRQMLSHTSGMPDMEESEYVELVLHPEQDDGAAERYVRGLKNRKLIANPGERFSYSNIAYNVLGDMIAKVLGKSFEDTMREHILIPSGMPNSTFMLTDIPIHLLAVPHLRSPEMRVNPIYPYHRADSPSSFLHTTVVELCHWAITALNRGNYLGQSLLSSAGYELMWTAVADRGNLRPSIYEEMGLGWTLGHFQDMKTVSHGGGGFGGTSFLLILPEKNCAAVILCNQESSAHFTVLRAAADTLIDQKPQANTVSWMVPISRALAEGGIDAAYTRYAEIKGRQDEYDFTEEDLLGLSLQLYSANKIYLAIEVLGLNIHVYPEYIDSYLEQAKLYLKIGKIEQAKESLLKALSIEPDNAAALGLLGLDPHLLTAPFKVQTNWHVITGAPSCGKTTLINLLADQGFRTIAEVARQYMQGEIARGRTIEEIHGDAAALQRIIVEMQLNVEAGLPANDIVFLDGGIPGSLAWYRAFGMNPNEILPDCFHHRYATVFVLDRLPVHLDSLRFEDEALSGFLDEWIPRDYVTVGYRVVRVPVMKPEERLAFILDKLSEQGLN